MYTEELNLMEEREERRIDLFVFATCLCRLVLVEKESNGQTRGKVGRV